MSEAVHPCPACGLPLRLIYDQPRKPKEYVCDVAVKGLLLGKIGRGYKHDAAWIFIEQSDNSYRKKPK